MRICGADYGTSALKLAVFDENLNMLESKTVEYSLICENGFVEFPAEEYLRLLTENLPSCDALAIDTQCETLVVADENGNALGNAIVWTDNRAHAEAEHLSRHFSLDTVYEITGQTEITPTWPACKLLWLRENRPEVWARTKKIFLLEDWLLFKLTGEFQTEKTLLSSSLYFNINTLDYWDEMLEVLGISRDMLPKIRGCGEYVGNYGKTRVYTCAIDQLATSLGAGITKGVIGETTGTTMTLTIPVDTIPRESFGYPCHVAIDGYVVLPWVPTAGLALRWLRDALGNGASYDELCGEARCIPFGCDGLRAEFSTDGSFSFVGITPRHTRAHMTRALLEGVARMLNDIILKLGIQPEKIILSGGGAKSPLWIEIKEQITGIKMQPAQNSDYSACLGCAMLIKGRLQI